MCIQSEFSAKDFLPCPKRKGELNAIHKHLINVVSHLDNSIENLEKSESVWRKISQSSIFFIKK